MVVVGAGDVVDVVGAVVGGAEAAVTGTTTGRTGTVAVVAETGGALLAAAVDPTVTGGAITVTGAEVVAGAAVVVGAAVVGGDVVVGGMVVAETIGQLTLASVLPAASLASSPETAAQYGSAGMPPRTKFEAVEVPDMTAIAETSGFGFPCASVLSAFSGKRY
ncbi:MAG: hypothetical protein M0000_02915 [Actinomycetota bacterium]|nr:hypothetical protein [Actinomycetota bacterium]MDA8209267.1 hypothetical protein [Actinomycetota bacterium]